MQPKVKQIILVRRDIKLPPGKLGAQASHASLGVVKKLMTDENQLVMLPGSPLDLWWNGSWTKVCLRLDSIDDLAGLLAKCDEADLQYCIVKDNGLTVYHGVPTITCIGIEPSTAEKLDPIFGHLKLL